MKHSQGFTIIEMIIVVALIGIISMIAAGYFGDNVIRANRTDARSALSDTSGSLEKCKSLYGAYDHGSCNVAFPLDSDSNHYAVTVVRDGTTFTLTATPVGAQLSADGDCATLTLTNTGIKGATGTDTSDCW